MKRTPYGISLALLAAGAFWLSGCLAARLTPPPPPSISWGEITLSRAEQAWLQDHATVLVHYEEWPPFMFMTEGKPSGIALDTLEQLLAQVDLQPEYVEGQWPETVQNFQQQTGVDILPVVGRTPAREEQMFLSSDYISFPLVIFTQSDAPFVGSMMDLSDQTVAVELNYMMHEALTREYPQIKLLVTNTSLEALRAVSTGKAQAYVGNLAVGSYLIQKYGLVNLKIAAPTSFEDHKLAIGIRSDQPELAAILEKALQAMPDEKRTQIQQKWLSIRYEYGISEKDVSLRTLRIIFAALILLGFVLYWNQRLTAEIKDRKKVEQALQEKEELLRHVLDADPAIIFLIDEAGRFVLVNQAAAQRYETTMEDMIGKTRFALPHRHPENQVEFAAFMEEDLEVIRTQKSKLIPQDPFTMTNGEVRWSQTYKTPFTLHNGLRCVLVISVDITERREAENRLAASENLLRAVVDAVPDLIMVKDRGGSFILVNQAAAAFYGLDVQEMQGRHEKDLIQLAGVAPDEIDKYLEMDYQVIDQKITLVIPEEPSPWGNKGLRWFHTTRLPLETRHTTDKVLVVSTNITDRKLALEALKEERTHLAQRVEERTAELVKLNIELQEAARAKDEFLANMSHELRTPLNAILGMSEILQEGLFGELNEKQMKYIGVIEESGQHLLSLISDILDLAKIESGQRELEYDTVSIQDVCTSSLALIQTQAHKKSISVSFQADLPVKHMEVDHRALKQILLNMLSNAVKFSPEGGKIGLEVSQDTLADMISFSVWDNGIGITPQQSQRLFKPFVQVDSSLSRNYDGTGLGLSLIFRLVDMHGGGVLLESSGVSGEGSRFTVRLPLHQIPPPSPPGVSPCNSHSRVLLMNDDPNNLRRSQSLLENWGCQVFITDSNMNLLRIAQEILPQLILIDLQIPLESSLSVIRELRLDPHTARIPILTLSSLQIPGNIELCVQAGANECMLKPVNAQQLTRWLEKYLLP